MKENEVILTHSRFKEIKRLEWVKLNALNEKSSQKFFPSIDALKNLLNQTPETHLKFSNHDFSRYSQMRTEENKWVQRKIKLLGQNYYDEELKKFIASPNY